MLFNSIDFAVFLPIVFILYWFVVSKNLRLQNILILISSYIFYGWWDYRFLSLIVISTIVDYFVGVELAKSHSKTRRKILLWTSIGVNLGILGFFKYFNFFLENFNQAFSFLGASIDSPALNIVLPVGISFYTFQTLSYSIDVYRGKLKPTRNLLEFASFVAFFPQLVAGPIERATNLLPQFNKKRKFEYKQAMDGVNQIIWGLFKKVVVADNCAKMVNEIFANYHDLNGSTLVLGAVLFAFQIYGDFSGYSDMAIGVSRLFGFNLMQNFAFPYFSRDIAEFWRRWHISLSTWFRDYLYIPLGGSKGSLKLKVRNTFIIFLVSGFWHGANWTFIVWGALNALYFLPLLLSSRNRRHLDNVASNRLFPSIREVLSVIGTFVLTTLAWVFFRAKDIHEALAYMSGIFNKSIFSAIEFENTLLMATCSVMVIALVVVEWFNRHKKHALEHRTSIWPIIVLIFIITIFGGEAQEFIYFDF
ncbi:MAG: MBOAT family protein [Bacteroidia bacterium]